MELRQAAATYTGLTFRDKLALIEYYNTFCVSLVKPSRRYSMKPTDNWCAMFVSVVARMLGYTGDLFPFEVSVLEQVKLAKQRGQYTTDPTEVKPNDLVIYNWNGDYVPDHVGIVDSISCDTLQVIEGNYQNTVGTRTVTLPSKHVQG